MRSEVRHSRSFGQRSPGPVAYGARAIHRHVLKPTEGGATRVFSEESMAGPLLVLFYNAPGWGPLGEWCQVKRARRREER